MNIRKKLNKYIIESQTYSLKNAPVYIKILTILYKLLGRKFVAKLFITSKRCDSCMRCVKLCPNEAIHFRLNSPRRNNRCQGCLLCVYVCPNQAIELPLSMLIGAFLLLFLPYDDYIKQLFSLQFSSMPAFPDMLISLLLWSVGYIIIIFLFGKISFLFSAVPIIKKFRDTDFVKQIYKKIHPVRIFPIIVPKKLQNGECKVL